jgi:large subunit ribosomal protein L49
VPLIVNFSFHHHRFSGFSPSGSPQNVRWHTSVSRPRSLPPCASRLPLPACLRPWLPFRHVADFLHYLPVSSKLVKIAWLWKKTFEPSRVSGMREKGHSQPHLQFRKGACIHFRSCSLEHWNKSKSNNSAVSCTASLLQSSYRPTSSQISLSAHQARTFLTQLRRDAQALKEQPFSSSTPLPKSGKQPKPTLSLTNLPYFVRRTGSNQLPVYLVTKAGGTKQLTKIQKTEGDLDALRSDLAQTLGIDTRSPDVSINRLTGHIIVKV